MSMKRKVSSLLPQLLLCIVAVGTQSTGCTIIEESNQNIIEIVAGGSDGGGGGVIPPGDFGSDPGCGLITCKSVNASCGLIGDGCGGVVNCGSCTAPQTCGGGGVPYQCGTSACVPRTKGAVCGSYTCGELSDGCGGTVNCGPDDGLCPPGQTCGGGG